MTKRRAAHASQTAGGMRVVHIFISRKFFYVNILVPSLIYEFISIHCLQYCPLSYRVIYTSCIKYEFQVCRDVDGRKVLYTVDFYQATKVIPDLIIYTLDQVLVNILK